MKKLVVLVCMGLLFGSFALALAQDEDDSGDMFMFKSQTHCPVSGDPVDKKYFVDTYGKRIYLCGPECQEVAKQDPEKYLDQLEMEGIDLEDTPE